MVTLTKTRLGEIKSKHPDTLIQVKSNQGFRPDSNSLEISHGHRLVSPPSCPGGLSPRVEEVVRKSSYD
jgi:hypothetical protein